MPSSVWWVILVVVAGILVAAAPLAYLLLLRRREGRLLKDQRRYHRTLIAASSGMTRIKDIETLCRLIVHVVNRTVRLTYTGLFLYEPKEQHYVLQAERQKSTLSDRLSVEATDSLNTVLQERKDLVILEELQAQTRQPDEHA